MLDVALIMLVVFMAAVMVWADEDIWTPPEGWTGLPPGPDGFTAEERTPGWFRKAKGL